MTFLNNVLNAIKEFFINYGKNPFLWVIIIILGLLIFELIYQALHKD